MEEDRTSHSKVPTYRSIFGAIRIRRAYYHAVGSPGVFRFNAELDLLERGHSYVVQAFSSRLAVAMSYEDSQEFLSPLFPVKMPIRSLERIVGDVCDEVGRFYEEKSPPDASAEAVVTVATVGKKGVVIHEAGEDHTRPVVVSDKPGKKKMATVISGHVIPHHVRTSDDIVGEVSDGKISVSNPKPENKITWGSLTVVFGYALAMFIHVAHVALSFRIAHNRSLAKVFFTRLCHYWKSQPRK